MKEVVPALEEAFRRESAGEAVNSPRTRSRAPGAVINAMHASLPYLGRSGLKCYLSSAKGTRFVFLLFDSKDSELLAVMGADVLGRFRTGGASGVATKHMHPSRNPTLAVLGSGRQALTQVIAIQTAVGLTRAKVWSPNPGHREAFAGKLSGLGIDAEAALTASGAMRGVQVASTITSAAVPFVEETAVEDLSHINVCGGNNPEHSEITAGAVGTFETIAVDDLPQAKTEYGDLIQAEAAGTFYWGKAVELKEIISGRVKPKGKTMFKSGGAALEDVAVASVVYDKAVKLGGFPEASLGFPTF